MHRRPRGSNPHAAQCTSSDRGVLAPTKRATAREEVGAETELQVVLGGSGLSPWSLARDPVRAWRCPPPGEDCGAFGSESCRGGVGVFFGCTRLVGGDVGSAGEDDASEDVLGY